MVDNKITFGKSPKLSGHNPGYSQMQADIWNGPTDRALQQFQSFSPFTSLSADCFFPSGTRETRSSSRWAFLQLRLGLAWLFIATPIKWWFWSIPSRTLLFSEVFRSPKERCSNPTCWKHEDRERVWIQPGPAGSEMPPPHVPPILPPGMSSDGSREPAAAQLRWVLTTNDLIPSTNKA